MRKGSYKVGEIGRIRVYSNISDVCNHTLAISLRVSCGVNRRIVDNTRTRFGFMKLIRTGHITKTQPKEDVPSSPCVREIGE
jgi:hypothetical protein